MDDIGPPRPPPEGEEEAEVGPPPPHTEDEDEPAPGPPKPPSNKKRKVRATAPYRVPQPRSPHAPPSRTRLAPASTPAPRILGFLSHTELTADWKVDQTTRLDIASPHIEPPARIHLWHTNPSPIERRSAAQALRWAFNDVDTWYTLTTGVQTGQSTHGVAFVEVHVRLLTGESEELQRRPPSHVHKPVWPPSRSTPP
jgi:hypothetical protein